MNTENNAINETGSPCDVPITPEYIEVPTANGRAKVRKDEMLKELYKTIDVFVGNLHFGA